MPATQRIVRGITSTQQWQLAKRRLLLPVIVIALLAASEATRTVTLSVLADAFWQVATFVAATLALYHWLSSKLNKQQGWLTQLLASHSYAQVIFAALMGALPGCGGAIVVVTQFVAGKMSFGAMVAVLTATMGDAAFLLLAARPEVGLTVILIGLLTGIVAGLIVDVIHQKPLFRSIPPSKQAPVESNCHCHNKAETNLWFPAQLLQGTFWKWLIVPAVIIALIQTFQVDIESLLHLPANSMTYSGAVLALTAMLLWATSRDISSYKSVVSEDPKTSGDTLFQKVAQDTNFVTCWVIAAFLLFELTLMFTGIELADIFANWYLLLPLAGVIIGLLPGCGPQILVTGLYLSGAIPLSAQLGNAISNDGDALFPAIALAPKAAILATFYSTIPALLVAYGYFILFEQ